MCSCWHWAALDSQSCLNSSDCFMIILEYLILPVEDPPDVLSVTTTQLGQGEWLVSLSLGRLLGHTEYWVIVIVFVRDKYYRIKCKVCLNLDQFLESLEFPAFIVFFFSWILNLSNSSGTILKSGATSLFEIILLKTLKMWR